MGPKLSVVIPTFNRRERLGRVLAALRNQNVSPELFEVVVVDDGSRDDTLAWLEQQSFPFAMQIESQANGGPAVARNAGVRAARGELVLFVDDDVVPTAELLEEHLKAHEREAQSVVVLGPLCSLPRYEQPWIAWEQAQLEKQYAAMEQGDYEPTYRQFWTGNASVGRRPLLEAGLFEPKCLRGEDVELGWRLAKRGLTFRYNPLARGFHHAERSLTSFCLAHESYGRLEVEIFGRDSAEGLLATLAENFRDLHPAQRAFLLQVLDRPAARRKADVALRAYLESPLAPRAPRATLRVCSLLANLHYWQASANALGAERFAEVRRRARGA